MNPRYLLALDQGTTSSRAVLFHTDLSVAAIAQEEYEQHFPRSGWVEHDPDDLWRTTVATARDAMEKAGAAAKDIAAIGISNQRETALVWDRKTGQPVYRAIVWQDRRTMDQCAALKAAGHEALVAAKTGLVLDPYFSATKIAWILDNISGARARAEAGDLCFGTVDSWLIWQLTGGRLHVTDATNASRTLLYDIHRGAWDDELLELFGVPRAMMPELRDCAGDFGQSEAVIFGGAIPIRGVAGDQQAALAGQACFQPGMVKSTYGTGCFALLHTGEKAVASKNRLVTTVASQLDGKRLYALEGSIFIAGAAVQWLRDALGLVKTAAETGPLAEAADPHQDVYLIPGFVGLGAPYWQPSLRGAMFGLTRATGPKEFARAVLESACYQSFDLIEAMRADWPHGALVLRVDGGMTASDWTMQRLADLLDAPVDRAAIQETTALGAAFFAGLSIGLFADTQSFAHAWRSDKRFTPTMDRALRKTKLEGWRAAMRGLLAQGN